MIRNVVLALIGCLSLYAASTYAYAAARVSVVQFIPDATDHCDPAEIQFDPTVGCVRPISGCICVASGGGTIATFGFCEGCQFSVSGVVDCTYATLPPSSHPFSCNTAVLCDGVSLCGTRCPCTGMAYFPIILKCGTCTQFP
jgi:hypothetical protein